MTVGAVTAVVAVTAAVTGVYGGAGTRNDGRGWKQKERRRDIR